MVAAFGAGRDWCMFQQKAVAHRQNQCRQGVRQGRSMSWFRQMEHSSKGATRLGSTPLDTSSSLSIHGTLTSCINHIP